jgi:hypothetical protein
MLQIFGYRSWCAEEKGSFKASSKLNDKGKTFRLVLNTAEINQSQKNIMQWAVFLFSASAGLNVLMTMIKKRRCLLNDAIKG